jgi:hypothetical protein
MIDRLKSWLLIASVTVLFLGPIATAGANHLIDRVLQAELPPAVHPMPHPTVPSDPPECSPLIDQTSYAVLDQLVPDPDITRAASSRMLVLFAADQAARQLPINTDPQTIQMEDTQRRHDALRYLQSGETWSTQDLVYAAFIFQHGDCPEHYRYAHRLAQIALEAGDLEAGWIYAATLDRYLMSLGKPQKFGTQYVGTGENFRLYPVDPSTTDEERAQYNVPPLSEALERAPSGSGSIPSSRQWLETWWLTLIGVCWAFLSGIIALIDPEPNARIGIIALAMALLILPISLAGHYLQVSALMQGRYADQQIAWRVVNGIALLFWFICAGVEMIRHKNGLAT